MLPMSTAAYKQPETIEEMIIRISVTGIMTKEDAQRILLSSSSNAFYVKHRGFVKQAIAVKLAGM